MQVTEALREFQQKLTGPLLSDITRSLEVTCQESGKSNHGNNFIANSVVLMGIEAVAQFLNPRTVQEMEEFRAKAAQAVDSLTGEVRRYVIPKYASVLGSELVRQFIKRFFDRRFSDEKPFGEPLWKWVWEFRNPHAHGFYPFSSKKSGRNRNLRINGAVDWLYKDSQARIGISIEEVERSFEEYRKKLYREDGEWFRLCPQVLFVYF